MKKATLATIMLQGPKEVQVKARRATKARRAVRVIKAIAAGVAERVEKAIAVERV